MLTDKSVRDSINHQLTGTLNSINAAQAELFRDLPNWRAAEQILRHADAHLTKATLLLSAIVSLYDPNQ